jgi:hypothetical protein
MSLIDMIQQAASNGAFDPASLVEDQPTVTRYTQYVEFCVEERTEPKSLNVWASGRGIAIKAWRNNGQLQDDLRAEIDAETPGYDLTKAIITSLCGKVSRSRIKYRSREINGTGVERKVLAEIADVFGISDREADSYLNAAREHHLASAPVDESAVYAEYVSLRKSLNLAYVDGAWRQNDMDRDADEVEQLITAKVHERKITGKQTLLIPALIPLYMAKDSMEMTDNLLVSVREHISRDFGLTPEQKQLHLRKMTDALHTAYRMRNDADVTHRMICHTMWQVKCRLLGINTDHVSGASVALIKTGAPHTGKTHGFHMLFECLGPAFYVPKGTLETMWDAFGARMFAKYYVYNLDEIAVSQTADTQQVQRLNIAKAFVTGKTNNTRRMHSMSIESNKIKATFVGSTNHSIKDVFPDRTGGMARRLYALDVGLRSREVPSDVEPEAYAIYFDPTNIHMMWSCIDETLPNGYTITSAETDLYRKLIAEQDTYIPESSFETWAKEHCTIDPDARLPLKDVYDRYAAWSLGKYNPIHKLNINQIVPDVQRFWPEVLVRTYAHAKVLGLKFRDVSGRADVGTQEYNSDRRDREQSRIASMDITHFSVDTLHAQQAARRVAEVIPC